MAARSKRPIPEYVKKYIKKYELSGLKSDTELKEIFQAAFLEAEQESAEAERKEQARLARPQLRREERQCFIQKKIIQFFNEIGEGFKVTPNRRITWYPPKEMLRSLSIDDQIKILKKLKIREERRPFIVRKLLEYAEETGQSYKVSPKGKLVWLPGRLDNG